MNDKLEQLRKFSEFEQEHRQAPGGRVHITAWAVDEIERLRAADARARHIASVAAEELIRCEAQAGSIPDEFFIAQCEIDDHMRQCIEHLCFHGQAVAIDTPDGYTVVVLGDFTLESLA